MDNQELNARLRELRQELPRGSLFVYHVNASELYIEKLTIPEHARGLGSRFMTKVLAAADEAELPVALHARSTGRLVDPDQAALEQWYARLGFVGMDEEDEGRYMFRSVSRSPEAIEINAPSVTKAPPRLRLR